MKIINVILILIFITGCYTLPDVDYQSENKIVNTSIEYSNNKEVLSDECALYLDKLRNCEAYECEFTHPFTGEKMQKKISQESGKCKTTEQMPNNGMETCIFDEAYRIKYVNHLDLLMNAKDTETKWDGEKYTIIADGVEIEPVANNALDEGICVTSGYREEPECYYNEDCSTEKTCPDGTKYFDTICNYNVCEQNVFTGGNPCFDETAEKNECTTDSDCSPKLSCEDGTAYHEIVCDNNNKCSQAVFAGGSPCFKEEIGCTSDDDCSPEMSCLDGTKYHDIKCEDNQCVQQMFTNEGPCPVEEEDCALFIEKLRDCEEYECEFTHPLTGDRLSLTISMENDKCIYTQGMPNNGMETCTFDEEYRIKYADYSAQIKGIEFESNWDGTEYHEYIDGVEVEPVAYNAMEDGTCVITGYMPEPECYYNEDCSTEQTCPDGSTYFDIICNYNVCEQQIFAGGSPCAI